MQERDPFEVIGKVPVGVSYQWVAISVMGDTEIAAYTIQVLRASGWTCVPAKRHPKMPKAGKRIVVGSQVLMQQKEVSVRAEREREIRAAREMFDGHPGSNSSKTSTHCGRQEAISSSIAPVDGPPLDFPGSDGVPREVMVTIPLRLSANLMEAAAVCHLSLEEYGRRMVILLQRGNLSGVLVQTLDREAFEVRDLSIVGRSHEH